MRFCSLAGWWAVSSIRHTVAFPSRLFQAMFVKHWAQLPWFRSLLPIRRRSAGGQITNRQLGSLDLPSLFENKQI
ncbi:hypothetical protein BDP55DRAFT_686503 [Colletotrichum godetiae]|uniref:Secreted protein n=1 Tax=Colletotrichum godetiae TaxID=1209918 RepID=A0AAJ0A620_9PEZI|nr:uncharacterized protein BDP55DRAFT_686503 [Colletotrichum godetiae]KAK1657171.1 hypothetical protein BDP55DRAFT_686503 [Colletotrichum godetiae]